MSDEVGVSLVRDKVGKACLPHCLVEGFPDGRPFRGTKALFR